MRGKKLKGAAYAKHQLIVAPQFTAIERDVLRTLLNEQESYTIDQAKQLIAQYAKRKVE